MENPILRQIASDITHRLCKEYVILPIGVMEIVNGELQGLAKELKRLGESHQEVLDAENLLERVGQGGPNLVAALKRFMILYHDNEIQFLKSKP